MNKKEKLRTPKKSRNKITLKSARDSQLLEIIGAGGATGMVDVQDIDKGKDVMDEYREGEESGQTLSETQDITSGADTITGADTTAYPSYIDEEDNVVSSKEPRTVVGQRVRKQKKRR